MKETHPDSLAPFMLLLRLPREKRVIETIPGFSHVEAVRWIGIGKRAPSAVPLLRTKRPIRGYPSWIACEQTPAAACFVRPGHQPMKRQS
jgi:hypothetical protein